MTNTERIEKIVASHDVCEYTFGDYGQIPFSDKVIHICRSDCPRYGHCWACPPAVGDIHDCMERTSAFKRFCLFSTVAEVSDSNNLAACLPAKKAHEALSRQIRAELRQTLPEHLMLSTGCSICDTCTYPDGPCRFPEERLSSMESHGIVLVNLIEAMGMCADYGNDMVVYFTMILYND